MAKNSAALAMSVTDPAGHYAKLTTQLGLKGHTASALMAFKKRHDDALRKVRTIVGLRCSWLRPL